MCKSKDFDAKQSYNKEKTTNVRIIFLLVKSTSPKKTLKSFRKTKLTENIFYGKENRDYELSNDISKIKNSISFIEKFASQGRHDRMFE